MRGEGGPLPDLSEFIDLHEPQNLVQEAMASVCSRLLTGWEGVTAQSCEFASISGGISNLSVKVAPHPQLGLRPVAVKVFGDKTELLVDRQREHTILQQLNAVGIGAQVLGTFANGRIEEFLVCQPLTPQEMRSERYIPRIASMLRNLHDLDVGIPREDSLFTVIRDWMSQVHALSFTTEPKRSAFQALDLAQMEAEIDEIEQLCVASGSPIKFTHNDLLSGNILFILEGDCAAGSLEPPMQLIDFEYSAFGPRGFDFGNHFNEYAGFECDYTRYPGPKQQKLFFKHYLIAGGDDVSEGLLDCMVAEANLFALASHIYWGVWALIQARHSPIDFDYLEYSGMRWSEYYNRKQEFLAQAKAVLG